MGCSSSVEAQNPPPKQQPQKPKPPPPKPTPEPIKQDPTPDAVDVHVEDDCPPVQDENNNQQASSTEEEELSKSTLADFRSLTKTIKEIEALNVEEQLNFEQLQLTKLETSLEKAKETVETLKAKEKEHSTLCHMEISDLLKGIEEAKDISEDDQNKYIETKSNRQTAEEEVCAIEESIEKLKESITKNQEKVNELIEAREKFDGVLERTFNGAYGSDHEDQLEFQVAQLTQLKTKVNLTHYKWSNGRTLMYHACCQLAFCGKRWQQVQITDADKHQARYAMLIEIRNNLTSSLQNIKRTKECLDVTLPYWEEMDSEFLERSIGSVFTDIRFPDNYAETLDTYNYYHWKAVLLFRWMEEKIESSLDKDRDSVEETLKEKSKELYEERLKLIKGILKVEEEEEPEDIAEPTTTEDVSTNENEGQNKASKYLAILVLFKPKAAATTTPNEEGGDEDTAPPPDDETTYDPLEAVPEKEATDDAPPPAEGECKRPRRVPLSELTPPMSTEELFSDLEKLKSLHNKQFDEFVNAQKANKDKMDNNLQDLLLKRRLRKKEDIDIKVDDEDTCDKTEGDKMEGDGGTDAPANEEESGTAAAADEDK